MAGRIRAHDWSTTPLGDSAKWPERVKAVVELVLASPLVSSVALLGDRLLIYNDAAARLYGEHHPGALGRPLAETFPDSYPTVATLYDRVFEGEAVQVAAQPLAVGSDGGGEVFDAYLTPVRDAAGAVIGAHMIGLEIGERLRTDAAMRDSAARYRALVNGIDQGFCTIEMAFDAEDRPTDYLFLEVSPSFERQTGIANAPGRWMREIAPDHDQRWFDFYGNIARTGESARVEDFSTPLGRWWEVYAFPVEKPADRRVGVLFRDITDRKRTEAALREREADLARVQEIGAVGGFNIEVVGELRSWRSPEYLRLHGLPPDTPSESHRDWRARIVPEDREIAERTLFAALEGDVTSYDNQYRIVRQNDGAVRWIQARANIERRPDGTPVRLVGAHVDVTDQKRAQEVLRESEERQAFLLALSDALRPLLDPIVIQSEASWMLGEHLQADRCGYAVIGADDEHATIHGDYHRSGVAPLAGAYRLTDFAPGILANMRRGETLTINDERGDAHDPDPVSAMLHQKFGTHAFIAVPLIKDARLVAVFFTHQRKARRWTRLEIALVQDVAERTWWAVEQARTEMALRETEKRLQQFGEASQDVLWIRDAQTLQWEYLTPAFETIYGLDRAAALRGDNMAGWLELVVPEDRDHAANSIGRVHDGESVTFEYRIRRPVDGRIRWLRNTDFPIQDAAGKVVRIGGIGHDVTALKETERALAAVERRQRTLIEGMPQLVWRAIEDGAWTWASPQWTDYTGQSEPESLGWGWLGPLHPDDRQKARDAWADATDQGGLDIEYRIAHGASGEYRWFHTRAVPVRDEQGGIVEWLGTSTDIDDLRNLQERQQVLVTELQHRTFNLMSVVRSMSDATLRSSASLDEFKPKFRARVDALARVQRMLSRLERGDRITFDELIRSELSVAGALQHEDGRVTLEGPDGVALRSGIVQILAMAMHELITNAMQYGALAHPGAQLAVRWRVERADDERPWLHVDWTETGVVMPPPGVGPAGTGQGRTLIEQALPFQLRARTTYVMAADGIRCSIALPLAPSAEAGKGSVDV